MDPSNPKVFYGPRRSRSPPEQRRRGSGSDSEAETEIEEPRQFKRLHRRLASETPPADSAPDARKRAKVARPLRRDMYGRAPLQRACERSNFEQVKALVAEGVDVNDRDFGGTTALHGAALQGDPQIVKHLLENGAIVDVRSGEDELDTPLMDAASAGHVEVVQLLLRHGADPRIVNRAGKTAIDFSNDNDDDEDSELVVELLQAAVAAQKGPIRDEKSSVAGTFPIKKEAPHVDPPVDTATSSDDTAYDYGRRYTRAEYVQRAARGDIVFLGTAIEHGWRPNAESLIQAAKFGHADVVGLMLAFGSSADEKHDGVTALHETLGRGHCGVVKLLLENGANLRWRDSTGRSYLDLVSSLPESAEERVVIESAFANQESQESQGSKKRTLSRSERRHSKGDTKESKAKEPKAKEAKAKEPKEEPSESRDELGKEKHDKLDKEKLEKHDKKRHDKKKVKIERSPSPPPKSAEEIAAEKAELEAQRAQLAELAARRERERKEREAQVLAAIDAAARKAAERKERAQSMSEHTPETRPTPSTPDMAEPEAPAGPISGHSGQTGHVGQTGHAANAGHAVASPSTAEGSPAPVTPEPAATVPSEAVSGLPLALRELAHAGTPQPTARRLMVLHKASGDLVLDVQVALALGNARLHQEFPDLSKQPVAASELAALWGVVGVWVAPGVGAGDRDAERAKFERLRPNWLLLSEVRKIPGAETLPVVPVSLKPVVPRVELAWNRLQDIPLRLAVKLSERAAESQWGRAL